jgi:hypothetical protein
MVAGLSCRQNVLLAPYRAFIWRGLLWHTGKNLPGREAYGRNKMRVAAVSKGGGYFTRLSGVSQMENGALIGSAPGSWCVADNYLYVRIRHGTQPAAEASAQEWLFGDLFIDIEFYLSDKEFNVTGGFGIKYGVTSAYHAKSSADSHGYGVLKFNSFKLSVLKDRVKTAPEMLLGNFVSFYTDDLSLEYEKMYIENVAYGFDMLDISCKDFRSRIADSVIDQQFNKDDYKNARGNSVLDDDVAKRYKSDAAGYCRAVPGDCVNGYAFDTENYRRYRFGYGEAVPDYVWDAANPELRRGVEIEVENGWRVMEKSASNSFEDNRWWTETVEETLPSGITITTTLVCVPAFAAHPPQTGYTVPDYEATPRRLRVTGWFHAELGQDAITRPREILKYLFNRYCCLPYDELYFNLQEINAELSLLDGAPCGVYLDKPEKLFNAVGRLQDGCVYGWQMAQYRGRITARTDNPDRAAAWNIKASDIMNVSELAVDCDGTNYVTGVSVNYAKNYAENTAKIYTDINAEAAILETRNVRKSKTIDTLLKNEEDARTRYNEEIRDSVKISRSVGGIKLYGEKWKNMRVYDMCGADVSIPGGKTLVKGRFKIMSVDFDTKSDITTIGIKEAV